MEPSNRNSKIQESFDRLNRSQETLESIMEFNAYRNNFTDLTERADRIVMMLLMTIAIDSSIIQNGFKLLTRPQCFQIKKTAESISDLLIIFRAALLPGNSLIPDVNRAIDDAKDITSKNCN